MDEWTQYLFENSRHLFSGSMLEMDLKFRFRMDSIEIDATCGDQFRTITIEDLTRLPDAIKYLNRELNLDPHEIMGSCCPQGITYQTLKPTTGEIKIVLQ